MFPCVRTLLRDSDGGTDAAEQQCLRPRLCVRPSGDSRVSGSGPSAPDGPSHSLPGSPGSQLLIDQGPGFSRPGGPRTYCCGLASGAFGASRGLWGRPAVTAQTIASVLGQLPTHHLPASLTHTFTLTRGGGEQKGWRWTSLTPVGRRCPI